MELETNVFLVLRLTDRTIETLRKNKKILVINSYYGKNIFKNCQVFLYWSLTLNEQVTVISWQPVTHLHVYWLSHTRTDFSFQSQRLLLRKKMCLCLVKKKKLSNRHNLLKTKFEICPNLIKNPLQLLKSQLDGYPGSTCRALMTLTFYP